MQIGACKIASAGLRDLCRVGGLTPASVGWAGPSALICPPSPLLQLALSHRVWTGQSLPNGTFATFRAVRGTCASLFSVQDGALPLCTYVPQTMHIIFLQMKIICNYLRNIFCSCLSLQTSFLRGRKSCICMTLWNHFFNLLVIMIVFF